MLGSDTELRLFASSVSKIAALIILLLTEYTRSLSIRSDTFCFSFVLLSLTGKSTGRAYGLTRVETIMKKIKSKNTRSVIDDIEKLGSTLLRDLKFMIVVFAQLFSGFFQEVDKLYRLCFQIVYHFIYAYHQCIVCDICNNTNNQTGYGCNHGLHDSSRECRDFDSCA